MGNYFSGNLEFQFRFKDDEFTKNLINFIMYVRKLDSPNITHTEFLNLYREYIETHDDVICKGLNLARDKYDQTRWVDIYLDAEAIDGAKFTKDHDFNPDHLIHMHSEYDEDELPTTPDEELNYQFMVKKLSDEYGIDAEHLAIYAYMSIDICERYNADKEWTELIDLWSPYISNDDIGTVCDEDYTFRKDYKRYNDKKFEHHEFCGEWCAEYYLEASCKRDFCDYLYQLGRRSVIEK